MRNQPKLSIKPQACSDEGIATIMTSILEDGLGEDLTAFYDMEQAGTREHAFISKDPDHALRWICRHVPKSKLLRVVNFNYDNPPDALGNETDEGEADDPSQSQHSGEGTSLKRKREKTTVEVNRALAKELNLNLARTVASSQDWANAKAPRMLSNEEQKYHSYVTSLPKIGISLAAQMTKQAEAVGSFDVFKDWAAVLAVWKRQARHGRGLLDEVVRYTGKVMATPMTSTIAHSSCASLNSSGLQDYEAENFRDSYFELEKMEADSIAGRMVKRYKLDAFYEQFEALDAKIRLQKSGTGRRGVRYDSVAKEVLFISTYTQELGREPNRDGDKELWQRFGEKLDRGKRWNMIKRRIGSIGVFGLMPHCLDPDTFVEQRLTQGRVGQWIEMVAACNEDARAMAMRMEPLFLACVQGRPPPDEFGFLEQVEGVDQSIKPLVFLTRGNIEEMADTEDEQ